LNSQFGHARIETEFVPGHDHMKEVRVSVQAGDLKAKPGAVAGFDPECRASGLQSAQLEAIAYVHDIGCAQAFQSCTAQKAS
jgi:hypothetical protein